MKRKYIYTIIAASCAMFASCSQEGEFASQTANPQGKAITEISASSDVESRAVLSTTDNTKINWASGDVIRVFGADGSSAETSSDYPLLSGEGTVNGAFKNASSTVSSIQAVMYPVQTTATWDNTAGKLTCNVPSVQTAVKGSFDKSAAIMYYFGNKTNVTLNSAVAFLKVTVAQTNLHAITIYSSDPMSGNVDITSSGIAAASTGAKTYVTLQASATTTDALAAGDYYIAVMPGTYNKLDIAYKYTDYTAKVKNAAGTLTMAAAHVKAISADFSTGTVRNAYQLENGGPYFAEMNIGATSAQTAGKYFAWGEIGEGHSGELKSGSDHECADNYNFDWSTMPFNNGSTTYNKDYFDNTGRALATGSATGTELLPIYDAATRSWGYAWKIPSADAWKTLDQNVRSGYTITGPDNKQYTQVTGPSGKVVYFHNSGYRGATNYGATSLGGAYPNFYNSSQQTYYQCSTLIEKTSEGSITYNHWGSYRMGVWPSANMWLGNYERFMGYNIRAVLSDWEKPIE